MVTFVAPSVELLCDGGVGETCILLEFAGVVVGLVVAAADWTVGLGTDCITDALRFWLMFRVTVLSITTIIDSLTVGPYRTKGNHVEPNSH